MSYLAIGSVTTAMAELLSKKLNKPPLMGGATFRVTILPPDDDRVSEENGVNLFLYKVTESPFAKNMNWRGDRVGPINGDRPGLVLSLNYLLTAYAKKTGAAAQDDITAHQLLGNSMAIFHDYPVLNDVHDGDFDAGLDSQFAPELRNSFEKVKISLLPISMDEFSKIWTGLSKAYRLSVAYEVSLVEIGPTIPRTGPAPAIQRTLVQTQAFTTPQITSVEPSSGPAGAQVKIKGQGFQSPGTDTVVTVGGVDFSPSDLISLSANEIDLVIPESLVGGPKVPIVVTVQGNQSPPATYQVVPWINRVVPLRGIPGIPVSIDFTVPSGATVAVEIDGQAATTTVDPTGKLVTAIVPMAIASNGAKSVVLILNDGSPKRSNALSFEVLPLITAVNLAVSPPPVKTTITLTGERLNGTDVAARVAGLLITKGTNATATQLVVQVDRVLAVTTPVSALVDGRESNALPSQLNQIIPAAAFAGDMVTLAGSGLSGRNVSVTFGATNVPLGPQSFASQFSVRVPPALAAGPVQVKATIDGRDTNSVSFTVSG